MKWLLLAAAILFLIFGSMTFAVAETILQEMLGAVVLTGAVMSFGAFVIILKLEDLNS